MRQDEFIARVMRNREYTGSGPAVFMEQVSPYGTTQIFKLPVQQATVRDTILGVVEAIYYSWKVVDRSDRPNEITSANPGAMRSWHQNDAHWLPDTTLALDTRTKKLTKASGDGTRVALSEKARAYHDYIVANKRLQNKQEKKEYDVSYTGYVEFTPCTTGENQWARLVYDYVNDRLFLSPAHYAPFTFRETPGTPPTIDSITVVNDLNSRDRGQKLNNPFVYLIKDGNRKSL